MLLAMICGVAVAAVRVVVVFTAQHYLLAMFISLYCSRYPSIVPVARYSACELARHRWEQPVVAVCGVVQAPATVPVFPADTYQRCRGDTCCCASRCVLLALAVLAFLCRSCLCCWCCWRWCHLAELFPSLLLLVTLL